MPVHEISGDKFKLTELKRDESDKENHCECGLNEQGVWQDEVFDRFGCDCSEKEEADNASA
jgi:hypothetical protein